MKKSGRGHYAEVPNDIPARGWKDIGKRIISQVKDDHVQIVSAGIGFYFFLALFPAIAALVSIYSLVLDPLQVQEQMASLTEILPSQAHEIISGILERMANEPDQKLGWSMAFGLLLSLWSANKGTAALFEGINIAYNESDSRNFFKKKALTLLFTLGGILMGILGVLIVILFPAFIEKFYLPDTLQNLLGVLRWVIIGSLLVFGLDLIYKVAPHRDNPRFSWVTWGAVIATFLWIGGSLLFSWYVNNFGSYGDLYGSFAAVIILLLWFFLTSFVVLLGAEINSEMEHQTRKDTTVGEKQPMGERGAYHADHVAGDDLK
ncbi:YihY/virulence factor BrkB family protein [Christiangramia salexigens]|uniref:Ribonuclease BN n=1 Tax=Christiangramia salexigens TaxID=1913577 RepID=A0A1L3J2G0_9FLAO|nr:YihY/virulence factor BrkB family protein [Christiangramia salexigens]APG59322.1 ribonuclease BN [Christiangramia salexigens]